MPNFTYLLCCYQTALNHEVPFYLLKATFDIFGLYMCIPSSSQETHGTFPAILDQPGKRGNVSTQVCAAALGPWCCSGLTVLGFTKATLAMLRLPELQLGRDHMQGQDQTGISCMQGAYLNLCASLRFPFRIF